MRSADDWNRDYPVGTPVIYHPIRRANGDFEGTPEHSRTSSTAWVLGHGDSVVKIEGRAGCVSLDHLVVKVARDA